MRLYQVTSAATERFAYDGLDRIAEYDGSNALQRRTVHGPGMDEPIVQYEGTATTDRRFLSSDERGSIISVTDSSGALLGLSKYDEFGNPQSTNLGAWGYTGQAWLPSMGIWYYKARDYEPELGRFLQTDPIDIEGGVNLYAYVGNDPVNWVDPFGLKTMAQCLAEAAAAAKNPDGTPVVCGTRSKPDPTPTFNTGPSGSGPGGPGVPRIRVLDPSTVDPKVLETCRSAVYRAGKGLENAGNITQLLGSSAVVFGALEWLFFATLTKVPAINPGVRSIEVGGGIVLSGTALKVGGNVFQGLAGDSGGFRDAISDGVFEIISKGTGANEVFGVLVDVGQESILSGARIRCN